MIKCPPLLTHKLVSGISILATYFSASKGKKRDGNWLNHGNILFKIGNQALWRDKKFTGLSRVSARLTCPTSSEMRSVTLEEHLALSQSRYLLCRILEPTQE